MNNQETLINKQSFKKIHLLSPKITQDMAGMWFEGAPYEAEYIYQINDSTPPPVNYAKHTLKPHSITHAEAPAHTIDGGKTIDSFFEDINNFIGKAVVIKLRGDKYKKINDGSNIFHWEVSKSELLIELNKFDSIPSKIIISTENHPIIDSGFHDPNYVLTLSQEAADFLVSLPNFHMYGTSWKSSDFKPGSKERPIHNTLFQKAYIVENLILDQVPQGIYDYTGIPLNLEGASESPVMPILRVID